MFRCIFVDFVACLIVAFIDRYFERLQVTLVSMTYIHMVAVNEHPATSDVTRHAGDKK